MNLTKKHIKILLICGILAPMLYIGFDALTALLYEGYSYTDQAISELSAIGAPTAGLWTILVFIFNPLIILFGMGVWLSAGNKRLIRITGILLISWGFLGFVWLLFPMNMRGNTGSISDMGHLVLAAIVPLLVIAFVGFGSGAGRKGFRTYSFLTIILTLVSGVLVWTYVPNVAAQLPTPGMGLIERIAVFSPMIWIMVLAVVLLRTEKGQSINPKRPLD